MAYWAFSDLYGQHNFYQSPLPPPQPYPTMVPSVSTTSAVLSPGS